MVISRRKVPPANSGQSKTIVCEASCPTVSHVGIGRYNYVHTMKVSLDKEQTSQWRCNHAGSSKQLWKPKRNTNMHTHAHAHMRNNMFLSLVRLTHIRLYIFSAYNTHNLAKNPLWLKGDMLNQLTSQARVERLFVKCYDNCTVVFICSWYKTGGDSLYKGYNGATFNQRHCSIYKASHLLSCSSHR